VRLSEFYVGDTTTVLGTWTILSAPICPPKVVYDSRTSPSKFTFRVLDTAIASVTRTGLVTARAVGETRVFAKINDEESWGEYVRVYARPSPVLRLVRAALTRSPRDVRAHLAARVTDTGQRAQTALRAGHLNPPQPCLW
jgi:hypothetical protein